MKKSLEPALAPALSQILTMGTDTHPPEETKPRFSATDSTYDKLGKSGGRRGEGRGHMACVCWQFTSTSIIDANLVADPLLLISDEKTEQELNHEVL